MHFDEATVKRLLDESLLIVREFEDLIDSYVLDFYVENHWNKLPPSWRSTFKHMPPHVLKELLVPQCENRVVWPLSLLALRNIIGRLALPRKFNVQNDNDSMKKSHYSTHPRLKMLISKQVKPKKMHEMDNMAKLCGENAKKYSTVYIVDFGAGIGHLARRLAFEHHLKVCCIEMKDEFNQQARQIDQQFIERGKKYLPPECLSNYSKPIHLTMTLTEDITPEVFIQYIRDAFGLSDCDNFTFGIVGLHPCGNLTAILLKLFLRIKEAKFLNIIGCCYMKLTTSTEGAQFKGYPLSRYLLSRPEPLSKLSYEAREAACHAIENYAMRLETRNYEYLKVHAYRAALERILVKNWPHFKHAGLRGVKNTELLTFSEYAKMAVANLSITLNDDELESEQVQLDLGIWNHVVIFYTLRLMFAPLVESIILYDRLLYLMEKGSDASIKIVFDPTISPRNHILIAGKR